VFSPPGYTSIFHLQNECEAGHDGKIGRRWQRQVWLHNALVSNGTLFAFSAEGTLVKVPKQVLARLEREYAFIDTRSWSISLRKLRDASNNFDSSNLQVAMYILGDSFVDYPGLEVAEGLAGYEGWILVVLDEDAKQIVSTVHLTTGDTEADNATPTKPMSTAQSVREWKHWVDTFSYPDKPNKYARREWGRERGIARERVEDLQREHSPDYWKQPGANRGPL